MPSKETPKKGQNTPHHGVAHCDGFVGLSLYDDVYVEAMRDNHYPDLADD